jgi:hypothetical protein
LGSVVSPLLHFFPPLPHLSLSFNQAEKWDASRVDKRLTVLGDGGRLGQREITILQERKVSNRVLLQELFSLVIALHGERRVVVELNTSKGGSG